MKKIFILLLLILTTNIFAQIKGPHRYEVNPDGNEYFYDDKGNILIHVFPYLQIIS